MSMVTFSILLLHIPHAKQSYTIVVVPAAPTAAVTVPVIIIAASEPIVISVSTISFYPVV
jgi:hypothetical protein